MPINQLYHDHGVADTLAQHTATLGSRAAHAAEATLINDRIQSKRTSDDGAVVPYADRFEVFRTEEVQVTSTQFAGGDWRWRLADAVDETLVEGGGYRSKRACDKAVKFLRDRAGSAS